MKKIENHERRRKTPRCGDGNRRTRGETRRETYVNVLAPKRRAESPAEPDPHATATSNTKTGKPDGCTAKPVANPKAAAHADPKAHPIAVKSSQTHGRCIPRPNHRVVIRSHVKTTRGMRMDTSIPRISLCDSISKS